MTAECPGCTKCTTFVPRLPLRGLVRFGPFTWETRQGFLGECVECHQLCRVQNGKAVKYRKAEKPPEQDNSDAEREERRRTMAQHHPDRDVKGLY